MRPDRADPGPAKNNLVYFAWQPQRQSLWHSPLQPQPLWQAQSWACLAQKQGWQPQSLHWQFWFLVTFVMVTSLVLVGDERGYRVCTMVRSQACPR